MTMTAPLRFADPISSTSTTSTNIAMMTGVDDRSNNGVCVDNGNCDNIIMNTIGNGNFFSSAAETETLVKPAHPANDGDDGSCADGDDTAKNTSSDDDDDDHDDDDFEIVSLEEERPQAIQTVTRISPMEDGREEKPREGQESRSASSNVREKHSVVVDDDDDCREELTRFFLREKHPSSPPQSTKQRSLSNSPSDAIASPSSTAADAPSSRPHRLRPLLLRVPPHTPLLLDVATTLPVVAHIHPSSPLRDHVSLGDVLVYIDGKNSVHWSFEALTRRLNSDAFGADGAERKTKKGNGNGSVFGKKEESAEDDEAAEGYRTLVVLPKEQFRQRPRRRRRRKTRRDDERDKIGGTDASCGEETESDSIVVVAPSKDRLELSNPVAVTKVDGDGNGEEGFREEEEEEVDIIDEEVREDVGIPTTGPPPATDKTAKPEQHSQQRPNEKKEEEEREYENLRRLVLRLQSQTSSLSPHQRRIYEESYELLKERDRELRRNRPPVDIDVIAIRRRGDTCVSLRISGREDGNSDGEEDEDEEFSVEEVSTIYGGKWNPAMYSASPRRLEDVLGYDVEEGYGYGGIHHHLYRNDNHYLTLAEGDAHDMAPIPPSHHIHSKHHRLDIAHPNILGLLHPAIHRYRFDADARNALLKEQDDQVRRSALESLKRQQKRVEGFFVSLMFASVGALIVILVMVFWAKD
mmetsp:Transcript_18897/g.39611  ORF Transcript_18897/g.39611 Transcript_18897/m.39611 type:complete len:694 (+) Transcript_18897:180-2261(+)